jgi:hypothetical protein
MFSLLTRVLSWAGLNKLSGWLLGFLSSSGPLAGFFLWIGKKISIKALVLPLQFVVMGALITFKVTFLIASISLVSWLYNRFHFLMDSLNGFISTDNVLGIAWSVLQSIGFVDALFDTFSSLSFVWFSVLILLVSKFVLHSLKLASDEMFKIGLLMGQ